LKTPGIPISFCAPLYKWRTEDGKLQAVYSESKFLVITTTGYLKRLEEAAKEKKRKEPQRRTNRKGRPLARSTRRPEKGNSLLLPGKALLHQAGHGD